MTILLHLAAWTILVALLALIWGLYLALRSAEKLGDLLRRMKP